VPWGLNACPEPNITALKDPADVKWKHLLSEDIEVPTPWAKAAFDSADFLWQQKRTEMNDQIAALQKSGAPNSRRAGPPTGRSTLGFPDKRASERDS